MDLDSSRVGVGLSKNIKWVKVKLFRAFHPSRGIGGKFSNSKGKNKFILTATIRSNNKIKLKGIFDSFFPKNKLTKICLKWISIAFLFCVELHSSGKDKYISLLVLLSAKLTLPPKL